LGANPTEAHRLAFKEAKKKDSKALFTFNKMLITNILRGFQRQQDPKKLVTF